jgi:hypothetical protein
VTLLLASLLACAPAPARQQAAAIELARAGLHPQAWDAAAAEPDPLLSAQARVWVLWSAGDLFGARRAVRQARLAHPRDPLLLEWQLQLCLSLRDSEGARAALDGLGAAAPAELARTAVEDLERASQRAGRATILARFVAFGAFAGSLVLLAWLARRAD